MAKPPTNSRDATGLAATQHVDTGSPSAESEAQAETSSEPGWVRYRVGDTFGRYVIEECLGSGGMGSVYAAFDPQLDRHVAIKHLHDGFSADGAVQLLSEAKMMAKLSHPNVVTIYEVGTADGQLHIAMECVRGPTLRDWVDQAPRTWSEIAAAHLDAGKGMMAAHEAGIVHRDFKPANVLLGQDGRVRVTDFGIAKIIDYAAPTEQTAPRGASPAANDLSAELAQPATGGFYETPGGPDTPRPRAATSPTATVYQMEESQRPAMVGMRTPQDHPMTRTGVVRGTPAFMAPEVFQGQPVTARSDQYSFCVSLWHCLFGDYPYQAADLVSLQVEVMVGNLRKIPSEPPVPKRLQRLLRRGLARDPAERFPSMKALLAELERTIHPPRRLVIALAAVVVAGALVVGSMWMSSRAEKPATCDGGTAKVTGVWGMDRPAELRKALGQHAGGAASGEMIGVIERELTSYASGWALAHDRACTETRIDKTQNDDVLAERMVCLDRLLDEFGALVGLMKDADTVALPGLLAAAFQMPPAKSCLLASSDRIEIPDALRTPISSIRSRLAQATALERSGRFTQGLAVAEAALADAVPLAHDPTTAAALLQVGRLQWRAGDPNAARETLIRTTTLAETAGMKELRVQSLIELVWVSAWELRNPEEGGVWGRLAEASLRADKVPRRSLVAELQEHMGGVHYYKNQFAEGVESVTTALNVWRQDLGAKHPAVAYADNKLAVLYLAKGDLDEALARIREAIEIYTEATKGHHPGLVFAENNLGSILMKMGDVEGAETHFQTALRLGTTALGANHAEVAVSYANLGAVAASREDYPKAIEHLEHALEIERSRLGDHHLSVSDSEENVATVYELAGQNAKARTHCEAALAIRREKLGAEHDSVKQTATRCGGL